MRYDCKYWCVIDGGSEDGVPKSYGCVLEGIAVPYGQECPCEFYERRKSKEE